MIKFKLSVISDEVSQDLERVAAFARRHSLEGVEIRTVWNTPPQDLIPRADEIKRILSKYDLKVCCIASPFFKADLDSEKEYRKHIEILEKCIDLAKKLDTDKIRGFAFWRKGNLKDYEDKILEKFQKPLEIIEKEGVYLALENEPATFLVNAKTVAYFIEKLSSKYVKAVWDPGNDIWDPEGEIPYPDGYNAIKKYMIHMHVKDGVKKGLEGKPEPRPIGEGDVDYLNQFIALIKDEYSGYISLETHWRPKKKLSEEELVKPGGAAFSEMGEEASEICINNLKKIIEDALKRARE
ncbi:MAG: sugar phosphate isomerase/epimerase [Thermoprotei archaeon]|nr:MAG: sugar phosphate isomerase/epimerase [Thermoprotei archaeon]